MFVEEEYQKMGDDNVIRSIYNLRTPVDLSIVPLCRDLCRDLSECLI